MSIGGGGGNFYRFKINVLTLLTMFQNENASSLVSFAIFNHIFYAPEAYLQNITTLWKRRGVVGTIL
jgi:hypothetical protein